MFTLEAAIVSWLRDHPRRNVEIHDCTGEGAYGVWLRDPAIGVPDSWYGEGKTVGEAVTDALCQHDCEGSDG